MKKIVARVLIPLALVAGLVVAPTSMASAADVGVNMNQACQISQGDGYVALLQNSSDAYSWRCRS